MLFRSVFAPRDSGLRRILLLMLPATIGLSATQLNIFINTNFAASCGQGAVSWLNYAFRLVQLPIGVFGVALSIAIMPVLAMGSDSPGTPSLWLEPVLLIRNRAGQGASSAKEIAYKSDQSVAFGRQPASLYGAVLYRANGHAFERMTLPKGTASENELDQSWRLAIGPDGVASGTLGFSLSGAWLDVLFPNGEPSLESASAKLKSAFLFGIHSDRKSVV